MSISNIHSLNCVFISLSEVSCEVLNENSFWSGAAWMVQHLQPGSDLSLGLVRVELTLTLWWCDAG